MQIYGTGMSLYLVQYFAECLNIHKFRFSFCLRAKITCQITYICNFNVDLFKFLQSLSPATVVCSIILPFGASCRTIIISYYVTPPATSLHHLFVIQSCQFHLLSEADCISKRSDLIFFFYNNNGILFSACYICRSRNAGIRYFS